MPASDFTLYAKWTENAEASYTVLFWTQNVNDDKSTVINDSGQTYDYKSSVSRRGSVGDFVSPTTADQAMGYVGFHYNATKSTAVSVGSDGSTVLNVYYDRNLVTLTFYTDNTLKTVYSDDVALSGVASGLVNGQMSGLWGQLLSTYGYQWPALYGSLWRSALDNTSNTFLSTFTPHYSKVAADNTMGDVFFYPGALTLSSTVQHYRQGLDGSYSPTPANETGVQANASWNFSNKYGGFTVSSYTLNNALDINGATGTAVAGSATTTTDDWVATAPAVVQQVGGAGITLRICYERNRYTISFLNPDGSSAGIADASLYYEAVISPAEPTDTTGLTRPATIDSDYYFDGWYLDPAGTVAVNWDMTMNASNLAVYAK